MAEKKPKKTREQILDEAKARTDAKLAAREARAAAQRAAAAAEKQARLKLSDVGNQQFSRDAINRQRLQATATRNTRAAQARPLPQVRASPLPGTTQLRTAPSVSPADMTPAQRFAADPAGGLQGRRYGAPAPPPQASPGVLDRLSTARPLSRAGRMLSRVGGAAMGPAGLLMEPETVEAPTAYPLDEQETFGMPQEEFLAQLIEAGIADPEQVIANLLQPPELGRMDAMQAPDPFDNEFLNYAPEQQPQEAPDINPILAAALGMRGMDVDLSGAFEPGMANDIPLAEQFTPRAGLSPYEFGRDYVNPALTAIPNAYSYLQDTVGRGTADLLRGTFGYDPLPEEQELIEAEDMGAPFVTAQQLADFNTPQDLEAVPDPMVDYGIISPDDLREQVMLEYMQGQQQADPRQRQIMGSADEFAANRPPPRMSPQQLDEYMRMIARDESINAGLAGDPFAGYDESLFPEQFVEEGRPRGVTVDPVTGATSFEGGQRYPRDAELTGRDSMDDLRLGTEYTSRALRNLGRARGVPSPQEVERSRLLSTLGGEARGQGYRADELADQMRRTRSGLNAANLTPLELDAGRAQLETLDSERTGALTAQDRARALQLRGTQAEPLTAPEDVVLEQLQEAATAQAQAEAAAEQRRWLTEREIAGRNQVGAQDLQRYTEMFSAMEPSAVPEGMPLSALDEDMQLQEQGRINRIQLATTLASSHEGFRTQPALAMEAARLLATLRGDPRRQTGYMNLILEADPSELGQVIQELYERLGAT